MKYSKGKVMLKLNRIYEDKRGEIYTITDKDDNEITILITRAGKARGGCIHQEEEHILVLSGYAEYNINDSINYCHKGGGLIIPRDTPHYYISHTDSVILEWGASFNNTIKDKETRKIVEDINGNMEC